MENKDILNLIKKIDEMCEEGIGINSGIGIVTTPNMSYLEICSTIVDLQFNDHVEIKTISELKKELVEVFKELKQKAEYALEVLENG